MVNQAVLACVKEVCHIVMNNEQPFDGKITVMLDENCQHILLFVVVLKHKLSMNPLNPHLYGIYSLYID